METIKYLELKKNKTDFPREKITCSKVASKFIRGFYNEDISIFESFFILLLDNSNHTIGYAKISQGGITGTVVDVRIVAKYAIDSLATSIILAHNHPSGTLKPSRADIAITEKLKKALQLLDVKVLEHIILTENSYYSFMDNGDM